MVARLDTATILPAPTLSLARSGNSLRLSWSAGADGYQLEATSDLNQPFAPPAEALAPVAGETNTFTVPQSSLHHFFRLVKP